MSFGGGGGGGSREEGENITLTQHSQISKSPSFCETSSDLYKAWEL